jgi:uncharacterized membrane protein
LGEQFFQIRVIFEIQLSWEVATVTMADQQNRFYREVLELSRNNTSKHNVLYNKEKVDELVDKVLHAKTVLKKNYQERHLLKKFDVMQVSGMQKLIRRQLNEGNLILNTIFYGSLTWLRLTSDLAISQ